MKTIYECSMSKFIKWMSLILVIVIFAAIVALLYDMIHNDNASFNAIGIIILILATLSAFSLYPQYIISTEEGIGIHMLIRTKWIKYENIVSIEKTDVRGSIRLCGIGGFLGNIGLYKNAKLGKYLSYLTDKNKAFVIYRKRGLPVVISVAEPDSFLPYLLKS